MYQHTKWSRYVTTIESCINEMYHQTIEVTPFEAHLGRKPTRVSERYLDKDIVGDGGADHNQIFVRMKEKRE